MPRTECLVVDGCGGFSHGRAGSRMIAQGPVCPRRVARARAMSRMGKYPAYTPPQFESSTPLVLVRGVDVRPALYGCSSSVRALFAQWAGRVGMFCAGE